MDSGRVDAFCFSRLTDRSTLSAAGDIQMLYEHICANCFADAIGPTGLEPDSYAVITLHRPSNVDDMEKFDEIITAFEEIQKEIESVLNEM